MFCALCVMGTHVAREMSSLLNFLLLVLVQVDS